MTAASFERLPVASRVKLGRQALKYLKTDAMIRYGYWALGRLGARTMMYAGVEQVLPRKEVEEWITELVPRSLKKSSKVAFEVAQLGKMTGDRGLDLSETSRNTLIEKVKEVPEHERALEMLERVVELDEGEQNNLYDEKPEVASRLIAYLSGRDQTQSGVSGPQGAEVELDAAEREELRALGYVP